jgi:hypothetical protein
MDLPSAAKGIKALWIWNGTEVVPIEQEPRSKWLITIETEHARIHDGQAYRVAIFWDLAASAKTYFQMKVWAKAIHLKEKKLIDGQNRVVCKLYEAPTVVDGNIVILALNANRNSTNTSSTQVFWYTVQPTPTGGTVLDIEYLPGTNQSAAGASVANIEYILKPNTTYLFEAENLDSQTTKMLSKCFWYETE